MSQNGNQTREQILAAALRRFAAGGYAAVSVQDIVSDARVTKPALYYYFPGKAHLYSALVDSAHDERYRLMQEAVRSGGTVLEQLQRIVASLFEFTRRNRDLMRLAFATAFAAPSELPEDVRALKKGRRNYEFVRDLIERAQAAGELDRQFDSEELAFGIYGQMNTYVMVHLMWPSCRLNQRTAQRVVELFLHGAKKKPRRRTGASIHS
jgi:AcrR family transcriptional regulator